MYHNTKSEQECCGCFACEKICGTAAVCMQKDKKGFYYPVVDEDKCVHCGRCEAVCPMEKNYVGVSAEPEIYAAACRDVRVVKNSSSGGVFSALCKWILKQDGVVYGAAFDESYSVRHMRGTSAEELRRFRGSKYVESDISAVYQQAEQDLREGRTVLLSGTPCQISALKAWLTLRKVPAERLYTCDIICHGVPSQKVWSDYLDLIREQYLAEGDQIQSVNMRSKQQAWESQELKISLKNRNIDKEIRDFSFNTLFHSLNLHRASCFHCRYTSYQRPGDLTLGDFWNYRQAKLSFQPDAGISEVLVNTEKGKKVLEAIRKDLLIQEISRKDSWQAHLEFSSKEPAGRNRFWEEYLKADKLSEKEQILRRYMKGSLLTRVIRAAGPVLRKTGLYSAAGKLYRTVVKK